MSGLVKTSPHQAVIERIERDGGFVLDHEHAAMDQAAGVALAVEKGFRKIAVTIALPEDAIRIRKIHPETLIFAVHVTGLTPGDAEVLASNADLITACASKPVREIAGKKALLQAGIAIPIFAMTGKGKDLIIGKIRQSDEQVLVRPTKLPSLGDQQPGPLV